MGTVFDSFSEGIWVYLGCPIIVLMGLYLTFISKGVQLREFPAIAANFFRLLWNNEESKDSSGVHPLRAFFACIGGSVGIGNIVGIATAIHVGGPGALFWIWVTAILGSLLKYSEVFLGMRHRVMTSEGPRGGPMYILRHAFSKKWPATLFCVLMSIYGVEMFQFSVITTSVSENFSISKYYIAFFFVGLVAFSEVGGVKRIGAICSRLIPLFILVYLSMGLFVLCAHFKELPQVFITIFTYAFSPHAAVGGFAGSAVLVTMSQGIQRACYSCDVGVGYASIVHSQSTVTRPEKQAALIIFEVFLDIFVICTMSALIVLVTGSWKEDVAPIYLIQNALSKHFPGMHLFIPFFLFLLGYMVITTSFFSGMKTAEHLSPKFGRAIYYIYASIVLCTAFLIDVSAAASIMLCILALLLTLNLIAIWKLRHELSFEVREQPQPVLEN